MKEQRIIAIIGAQSCMILANTSKGEIFPCVWIGLAIYWTARYFYLKNFKCIISLVK